MGETGLRTKVAADARIGFTAMVEPSGMTNDYHVLRGVGPRLTFSPDHSSA
jgi:hypothetical protein